MWRNGNAMNPIIQLLNNVNQNSFNSMLDVLNKAEKLNMSDSKKIKISFLRNFTIEPIEPFLKFHSYKFGIKPEYVFGDYDSIRQEILNTASVLFTHQPEIVVLSLHYHMNDLFTYPQLSHIEKFKEEIEDIFHLLMKRSDALILVNTFIPPFYSSFGIKDSAIVGAPYNYVFLNQWIREYVLKYPSRFFLMDWERYVRLLGEENSMDYRYWYMYRAPFKKNFLNLYAQDILKVVRILKGCIKKCLVLDCDNTLWGGIVGEDGINGIKLNNYEFPGKIFYDFQQMVLSLYKRGVILALCSKNNEQDVWEVLEKHPHSVLRKNHIVAARINWEDKVSNILSLSKELNLNLDSFIFIDDSIMECELVQTALPDVTVLTVPSDLYQYPQLLWKEGWFDTFSINEEDSNRTLMYQQENVRKHFSEKFENLEDYLSSLELEVTIRSVKQEEITRVAQLTQKTNQFNLSVKRYSENDIEKFINSNNSVVFSLAAKDKFGSYGLTGVLIATRQCSVGVIDSFLLSCRILSRKIEYIFMSYCLNFLNKLWKIQSWQAIFFSTEKNFQVKKFLTEFGFTIISEQDNTQVYQLPIASCYETIEYIKVVGDESI